MSIGAEATGDRQISARERPTPTTEDHQLLTDPFLQRPAGQSVSVVWFTNFEGRSHHLAYGNDIKIDADTTQMTRMYEDAESTRPDTSYSGLTRRPVYRHEAVATRLTRGERLEYAVTSVDRSGQSFTSETFTLAPEPRKGQGLQILLTSDLQIKPNAVANYQKVVETVGVPDAVFFAGDFVNTPDRASQWFDQARKNAPPFFPSLQGRYRDYLPDASYKGGAILQHAPLFGAMGNHEVMGRFNPESEDYTLKQGFKAAQPKWYARIAYERDKAEINPENDPAVRKQWIADHSHNQKSYLEVFSLPENDSGGETYYAVSFGDVFLISLNVSRIARSWSVAENRQGKFVERRDDVDNPQQWGFGEFMFERFDAGSRQFQWLQDVLESKAFKQAEHTVVIAHQSAFGLGNNAVPVLTRPQLQIVEPDGSGGESVTAFKYPVSLENWNKAVLPKLQTASEIRYEYPLDKDIWLNDIEPLLVEHGVDLVQTGHSHLWNRSKVGDMHYLETSNVGNSYGAYFIDKTGAYKKDRRADYATFWKDLNSAEPRWNADNYPPNGDPHGRETALPSVFSPMNRVDDSYPALPFVASDELSVFSILDTGEGRVESYVFDPNDPSSEARLFDTFPIGK